MGLIRHGVETSFNAVTGVVATGLVTGAIATEHIFKTIGDISDRFGRANDEMDNLNSNTSDSETLDNKKPRGSSKAFNSV